MEKIMSRKWVKVVLLLAMLGRLCACALAITTAADAAPLGSTGNAAEVTRVALLLPLRSPVLAEAADAVRSGFLSAAERQPDKLVVTVIETGDEVAQVLATYRQLSARYDIIVGPMSRSTVTALAQSAGIVKPTIALAQMDTTDLSNAPGGAEPQLPPQMLIMGLSIEDEARQIALWTERAKRPGKIIVLSTPVAWQRRAAKAYTELAQRIGLTVEHLELNLAKGVISASALAQLSQRMQDEQPALLFVALDAEQTIQIRHAVGPTVPVYGTSQINPLTLAAGGKRLPELNGVYLLDMPWQLQADHPAVYPLAPGNGRLNADLERMYALGIDAFAVAHHISLQRSGFDIDGVTGQIYVNMSPAATYFQRRETHAVYQDGVAVPVSAQR